MSPLGLKEQFHGHEEDANVFPKWVFLLQDSFTYNIKDIIWFWNIHHLSLEVTPRILEKMNEDQGKTSFIVYINVTFLRTVRKFLKRLGNENSPFVCTTSCHRDGR